MNDRTKTTILLVEDDALLRKSLSRFISQKGYNTLEAENGYEALKTFRKNKPDLVLTDLRMPVMDGFDLISELKDSSPRTPIIIFSGVSRQDTLDAVTLGACDYISKPVKNIGSLIERIEKALVRTQSSSFHSADGEQQPPAQTADAAKKEPTAQAAPQTSSLAEIEWQATADMIPHPIGILKEDHCLTRANIFMARLLEKDLTEIVGTTCFLSSRGFNNPQQASIDLAAVFQGKDITGRFSAEDNLTYEVAMRPYYDPAHSAVAGCVYIARAVSED